MKEYKIDMDMDGEELRLGNRQRNLYQKNSNINNKKYIPYNTN